MEIVWQLVPAMLIGLSVGGLVMGGLWVYYRRNYAPQATRRR